MAAKLWGEMPVVRNDDPELSIFAKIEPRPVDVIGAKLFPPCASSPEPPFYVDDGIRCSQTLHSIRLIAYKKKVASLLSDLQKLKKKEHDHCKSERGSPIKFAQTPSIPGALPFMNHGAKGKSTCFAEGEGEAPVLISSRIAWKILRKAVIYICAHAGYDVIAGSTLDILTNITETFIKNVCRLVYFHAFDKLNPDSTIFPDALEHACVDMNIESLTSLLDFYKRNVVQYHSKLMEDCVEMMNKYEKFKAYQPKPIEEKKREQEKKKRKLEKKVPKSKKVAKTKPLKETSASPQKMEKTEKIKKESRVESSSSKSEKKIKRSSKPCKKKSSSGTTKKSDSDKKKDHHIHRSSVPSTSAHVSKSTVKMPKRDHSSHDQTADTNRSGKSPRKR